MEESGVYTTRFDRSSRQYFDVHFTLSNSNLKNSTTVILRIAAEPVSTASQRSLRELHKVLKQWDSEILASIKSGK